MVDCTRKVIRFGLHRIFTFDLGDGTENFDGNFFVSIVTEQDCIKPSGTQFSLE
jgi:hypothetical protein